MSPLSSARYEVREALARLVAQAFPFWSTNMVRYAVAVYYEEVNDDDNMRPMLHDLMIGKYDGHELLRNVSGLPDLRN